jgi:hypothetical protein
MGMERHCLQILPLLRHEATMARASGVRLLEPLKAPIACTIRPGAVFARSEACEPAWDRITPPENSKDGIVRYKTVRETCYTAIRRLRCHMMVLYGYWL